MSPRPAGISLQALRGVGNHSNLTHSRKTSLPKTRIGFSRRRLFSRWRATTSVSPLCLPSPSQRISLPHRLEQALRPRRNLRGPREWFIATPRQSRKATTEAAKPSRFCGRFADSTAKCRRRTTLEVGQSLDANCGSSGSAVRSRLRPSERVVPRPDRSGPANTDFVQTHLCPFLLESLRSRAFCSLDYFPSLASRLQGSGQAPVGRR